MYPRGISTTPAILIVDGYPFVRAMMRDALEGEGFAVQEAEDGLAACRLCKESVPALLVVDADMPHMDGFELCTELRNRRATAHVPILMATDLDDLGSIAEAYEAGATDFIAKPFNWLFLSHRICYMLRAAKQREREQNERFEVALSNMSQGLCMFGADDRLIVRNHRFCEIYQLSPVAVSPGQSLTEILCRSPLFAAQAGDRARSALAEHLALTASRASAVLTQALPDGRVIAITLEPMAGGGYVDTFTDVTEERLAEARIAHMAQHDPLTDLANRMLFRQRLEESLRRVGRGESCAVLSLDLDQFKSVNDTLGHPIGDVLLKAVAGRLRQLVRETDTIARLGGDEFAIVQCGIRDTSDTTGLATHLIRDLSAPYSIAGHHLVIGTSIGIALAQKNGMDADQLLKSADMALSGAKSRGRNRYQFFEPQMDALMQARRLLELDLRTAMSAREFELFYQPLVNLQSEDVTGFEALLRWRSPRRGRVPPSEFIPLSEEIGLIDQIGEWVLHQASREAVAWPGDLRVAVNVSAAQFKSGRLLQTVIDALESSGLDPSRLELEITESVMISDIAGALSLLHQLKALGVGISMDDFGTGYSSLSYLRSFPFDKIKIDQSFVRELGKKADATAIVRAVTGLCNTLGVTATAEGVETQQQLVMLRKEQCTEVHGYLIGSPRPAAEIRHLLRDFRRGDLAGLDLGASRGRPVLAAAPEF